MRREIGKTLWCRSRWVHVAGLMAVLLLLPRFAAADECYISSDDYGPNGQDEALVDLQEMVNNPDCEVVFLEGHFHFTDPIYVDRPVRIEGVGRVPNNGSVVSSDYTSEVPDTRIVTDDLGSRYLATFVANSSFIVRNLWIESSSGAVVSWGPEAPNGEPFVCEDNVMIGDWFGISYWNADHPIDIRNNYIRTLGRKEEQEDGTFERAESWTALMFWWDPPNPDEGVVNTADVNVIGNYFEYFKTMWAIELGGPGDSSRIEFSHNFVTGRTLENLTSSYGDGNVRFVGDGGAEFIVVGNELFEIDSPNGCGILLKAVTNRATVVSNSFRDLELGTCEVLDWQTGAIVTAVSPWGDITRNCTIVNNDYTESGLTGLDASIGLNPPLGVPFVTLDADSEDNMVNEFRFPEGLSGPDEMFVYDLGTDNRVHVH